VPFVSCTFSLTFGTLFLKQVLREFIWYSVKASSASSNSNALCKDKFDKAVQLLNDAGLNVQDIANVTQWCQKQGKPPFNDPKPEAAGKAVLDNARVNGQGATFYKDALAGDKTKEIIEAWRDAYACQVDSGLPNPSAGCRRDLLTEILDLPNW
jgi:hypothetical protein